MCKPKIEDSIVSVLSDLWKCNIFLHNVVDDLLVKAEEGLASLLVKKQRAVEPVKPEESILLIPEQCETVQIDFPDFCIPEEKVKVRRVI